jgi:hypothetical protein
VNLVSFTVFDLWEDLTMTTPTELQFTMTEVLGPAVYAGRRPGEWHWACPFCGHPSSLHTLPQREGYPDRWKCCECPEQDEDHPRNWGDAYQLLRRLRDIGDPRGRGTYRGRHQRVVEECQRRYQKLLAAQERAGPGSANVNGAETEARPGPRAAGGSKHAGGGQAAPRTGGRASSKHGDAKEAKAARAGRTLDGNSAASTGQAQPAGDSFSGGLGPLTLKEQQLTADIELLHEELEEEEKAHHTERQRLEEQAAQCQADYDELEASIGPELVDELAGRCDTGPRLGLTPEIAAPLERWVGKHLSATEERALATTYALEQWARASKHELEGRVQAAGLDLDQLERFCWERARRGCAAVHASYCRDPRCVECRYRRGDYERERREKEEAERQQQRAAADAHFETCTAMGCEWCERIREQRERYLLCHGTEEDHLNLCKHTDCGICQGIKRKQRRRAWRQEGLTKKEVQEREDDFEWLQRHVKECDDPDCQDERCRLARGLPSLYERCGL